MIISTGSDSDSPAPVLSSLILLENAAGKTLHAQLLVYIIYKNTNYDDTKCRHSWYAVRFVLSLLPNKKSQILLQLHKGCNAFTFSQPDSAVCKSMYSTGLVSNITCSNSQLSNTAIAKHELI